MAKKVLRQRTIVIAAIALSILLYMLGVMSGLFANRVLKEETRQSMESLQGYISFLDTNLHSMQLEQTFMETLSREERCKFSSISLDALVQQLGYYWDKLPYRLEEYERTHQPTRDYLALKRQYADLSIRTWIVAKGRYDLCATDNVHGLYFYSGDCTNCVEQGVQLDDLRNRIKSQGGELIMFPIDFHMDNPTIGNFKTFYGINATPALILNDRVFQGRVFSSDELFSSINWTRGDLPKPVETAVDG